MKLLLKCSDFIAAATFAVLCSLAHADPHTALLALANAVDPVHSLGWTAAGDFCTFDGIFCSGTDVSAIDISGKQLTGTLPDGIWAELPLMSYLTATDNRISGAVPSFTGAVALESLDLGSNAFSGTIPAALATLPALIYVNLRDNPGICGVSSYRAQYVKFDVDPTAKNSCNNIHICGPRQKAPLTRSYAFTITNTARTWGATRDTLVAALQKVYKKYNTPYPPTTKLGGPAGQVKSPRTKRTVWRFTATLSIGAKNQCKPRGDAMHAALRKALAIPGSSIKA
jgi:hypothetical protein